MVESAATSLDLDRADKGRIYAAAGVPVYMILNVNVPQVELYTHPTGTGASASYDPPQIFTGDELVPLLIGGHKIGDIPARDMLP